MDIPDAKQALADETTVLRARLIRLGRIHPEWPDELFFSKAGLI